jgi:predicted DNA-binding transcriptional regulator AlpA
MTQVVKQLQRCKDCGHFAINHHGGGGGKPASGRCVAPAGDGLCPCQHFVEGYVDPLPEGTSWYERAINAANRIDIAHTTPWKVATVYSLLAVAESLGATAHGNPPPQPHGELAPRRAGDTDKDLLTAQDVAHMTGLSVHTLSWWRFNGGPGPTHLKLGRRVFYRRTEVEQWLAQAGSGEGT